MSSKNASLLTFPCPYVVKVVATQAFSLASLLALFKTHVPEIVESDIRVKNSKQDKYVSFSVNFQAQSQAQLDALYRALSAEKDIVFVL